MSDMNYTESERMVHALAHRVQRRLAAISQPILSYDDIVQELWIAWCKARDRYDASRGIPWSAYLQRGMKHHINRVIEAQLERFEGQTFAYSINQEGDEEEGSQLGDRLEDDNAVNPEQMVEQMSNYNKALKHLSEPARQFVTFLHEQPPELLNELIVAQDKQEHATRIGAPYNAPRRLTATMIFDLLGLNHAQRREVKLEVENMGMRLTK